MSLFAELRRRNVFRVALLYIVAAWLIMQVADVGISLLGLPDWTGRFVFLLLAIGFPLVVVFSWVYEITPEGVKLEKEVDRDKSITQQTARKLDVAVIVLLFIAIAGLALDRLLPNRTATPDTALASAAAPAQSIAVLPFVNMSADADNEYFSDGLSEELLNLLARIPELQVAARTSAFRFKGSDATIPDIAAQLNVAHILEGSVRKSGDDIRITAQLIKASDGYHLWSHTWDRTLTDVFAIQDEIAAAVVDALKVTLLGAVPKVRTTDPHAYELYLRAKAADEVRSEASMTEATRLLTQALAIDPEYAEAWVELGTIQTNMTGMGFLPIAEGFARARASAERAIAIDPGLARAWSNLGWIAMYHDWDFVRAAELIKRARELEPGSASVMNSAAVLNGMFGRRERMLSLYEAALERDPVSMSVLGNLASTYMAFGRIDDGAALIERMRAISPDSTTVRVNEALHAYWRGEAELAYDRFSAIGADNANLGRALTLYDLGRDDELQAQIETMTKAGTRPTIMALVEVNRGNVDVCFEWLDRAYEERDDWLTEIRMYVLFDVLHSDPRWEVLLQRIGISDQDAARIDI